jgi:DNA invertase Pin-like site-specific DNA recombinase
MADVTTVAPAACPSAARSMSTRARPSRPLSPRTRARAASSRRSHWRSSANASCLITIKRTFLLPVDAMQIDAYVRVSQIRGRGGESFISPTSQREQIAAWAKSKGHRVARVHEELDASGATIERPKLAEAMRRVEAGETGGIAVVKLDRFGRTLVDSLGMIERIERAGGTFASVQEGFDLTTPTGRLVLRMMLSLAEWELDRIRGNWEEARERAVARGLHLTATVPLRLPAARRQRTRTAPAQWADRLGSCAARPWPSAR